MATKINENNIDQLTEVVINGAYKPLVKDVLTYIDNIVKDNNGKTVITKHPVKIEVTIDSKTLVNMICKSVNDEYINKNDKDKDSLDTIIPVVENKEAKEDKEEINYNNKKIVEDSIKKTVKGEKDEVEIVSQSVDIGDDEVEISEKDTTLLNDDKADEFEDILNEFDEDTLIDDSILEDDEQKENVKELNQELNQELSQDVSMDDLDIDSLVDQYEKKEEDDLAKVEEQINEKNDLEEINDLLGSEEDDKADENKKAKTTKTKDLSDDLELDSMLEDLDLEKSEKNVDIKKQSYTPKSEPAVVSNDATDSGDDDLNTLLGELDNGPKDIKHKKEVKDKSVKDKDRSGVKTTVDDVLKKSDNDLDAELESLLNSTDGGEFDDILGINE